jgi:hypothetical protein
MAELKLLDQYRERLRVKHYSLRTEDAYLHWARRFIYFHGKRHPREMGGPEVEAFLSHLATEGRVASSTQNQALAAILFLCAEQRWARREKPAGPHGAADRGISRSVVCVRSGARKRVTLEVNDFASRDFPLASTQAFRVHQTQKSWRNCSHIRT